MTALIHGAWHQVKITLHTPRRLNVLLVLALAIAALGVALAFQAAPSAVLYNQGHIPVIAPVEAEVCLGGTVHYQLTTTIDESEIPGRIEVDEAWCMAGIGGVCKSVPAPNPRLPMLEPKHIVSDPASRTVPDTLTPGTWHLWHTATDTRGEVSGYIVAPVRVVDCASP